MGNDRDEMTIGMDENSNAPSVFVREMMSEEVDDMEVHDIPVVESPSTEPAPPSPANQVAATVPQTMVPGTDDPGYLAWKNASRVSGRAVGIMCFIAVFVFSWLLAVAYHMAGRTYGWAIWLAVFVPAMIGASAPAEEGVFFGVIALVVHVAAWAKLQSDVGHYQRTFARETEAKIAAAAAAVARDPADGRAWLQKAGGLAEAGRDREATESYARGLSLTDGNAEDWHRYAELLRSNGDIDQAAAAFEEAVDRIGASRDDAPQYHRDLAKTLKKLGRRDAAGEHYAEAKRLARSA